MPRRTAKKKTVKKKTAVKRAPSKKTTAKRASAKPKPDAENEFDSWAEALAPKTTACSVCREAESAATVERMLDAMARKRAYRVTVSTIHATLLKKHPDSEIGQRGLERHLRSCVRSLYWKARGRKKHG